MEVHKHTGLSESGYVTVSVLIGAYKGEMLDTDSPSSQLLFVLCVKFAIVTVLKFGGCCHCCIFSRLDVLGAGPDGHS